MKTVTTLLEIEMASQLSSVISNVSVFPGQSDGTRPDQYISVVATENEYRGSASLVTLEFRVVAPVFQTLDWVQSTQGAVYSWAIAEGSPLSSYQANGLVIFGHSPAIYRTEVKDAQRASIIEFKVGAAAS